MLRRLLLHSSVSVAAVATVATALTTAGHAAPARAAVPRAAHPITIVLPPQAFAHVASATPPSSLRYALLPNGINGGITRWNPCAAIRWQINLHNAPKGALKVAREAVRRISLASGLHFTYAGTTKVIPQNNFGGDGNGPGGWPPLTIAWALPGTGAGHSDVLPGGQTVGMGGTISTATVDGTGWDVRIATAYVVLDAHASKYFPANFNAQPSLGALLMHELGHAVGLGHAGDTHEIMYPSMQQGHPSTWGSGDKTALHLVGPTAGCIPTS